MVRHTSLSIVTPRSCCDCWSCIVGNPHVDRNCPTGAGPIEQIGTSGKSRATGLSRKVRLEFLKLFGNLRDEAQRAANGPLGRVSVVWRDDLANDFSPLRLPRPQSGAPAAAPVRAGRLARMSSDMPETAQANSGMLPLPGMRLISIQSVSGPLMPSTVVKAVSNPWCRRVPLACAVKSHARPLGYANHVGAMPVSA